MTIYYCYDAYCGWCYGFSDVMVRIYEKYKNEISFETLSGGMIPKESAQHIGKIASYIKGAYKKVEEMTGVKFGEDYLWHINNPDKSDWYPDSEKPAIAMAIFREYFPDATILFASELQKALHVEGRDLTDDEAYRHLLLKYDMDPGEFYKKLHSEEYKEKAYYDFALVKQLQVTGFPAVLMQIDDLKFYLISRGFSDYDSLIERIEKIKNEFKVS